MHKRIDWVDSGGADNQPTGGSAYPRATTFGAGHLEARTASSISSRGTYSGSLDLLDELRWLRLVERHCSLLESAR
jgi:hypothetical protein